MNYTHPNFRDFLQRYSEGIHINDHVPALSNQCVITPTSKESFQRIAAFLSMSNVKFRTRDGGYVMSSNTFVTEIVFDMGQNPALDATVLEMSREYDRQRNLNNMELRITRYIRRQTLEQLKAKVQKLETITFTNRAQNTQKKYIGLRFHRDDIADAQQMLQNLGISTEQKVVPDQGETATILRCPIEDLSDDAIRILEELEDETNRRAQEPIKAPFKEEEIKWQPSNGASFSRRGI